MLTFSITKPYEVTSYKYFSERVYFNTGCYKLKLGPPWPKSQTHNHLAPIRFGLILCLTGSFFHDRLLADLQKVDGSNPDS